MFFETLKVQAILTLSKFIKNMKENGKFMNLFPDIKSQSYKKEIIYLSWNVSKIQHISKLNCVIVPLTLKKKKRDNLNICGRDTDKI